MADDKNINDEKVVENSQSEVDAGNSSETAKQAAEKSGLGFWGWLILLICILFGAWTLALPRLDANSPLGERLAAVPFLKDRMNSSASNADSSNNSETSDSAANDNNDATSEINAAADETVSEGEALDDQTNEAVDNTDQSQADSATDANSSDMSDTTDEASDTQADNVETTAADQTVSEGEALDNQTNEAVENADPSQSDNEETSEEAVENENAGDMQSEDAEETAADETVAEGEALDNQTDEAIEGENTAEENTTEEHTTESAAETSTDSSSDQNSNEALSSENEELKTQIEELKQQLETTKNNSGEIEATAENAQKQKAVTDLKLAILGGTSFDSSVQELEAAGVTVPDTLKTDAQDIPTAVELENDFGGYAMQAIRASKVAEAGDGWFDGIFARIGSEYAARSLTPQEGNTPNDVLSRAENSLREGDLEGALNDVALLPSEAQEAMKPWIESANKRLDVLSALANISNEVGVKTEDNQ